MNKLNNSSTILLQDTSEPDLPEKAKQRVRKQPDRRDRREKVEARGATRHKTGKKQEPRRVAREWARVRPTRTQSSQSGTEGSVSSPERKKPAKKKKKGMLSESSELEISSTGNDT